MKLLYFKKANFRFRFKNMWFVFILLSIIIASCNDSDKYFRPDLTEKLCIVGIIDDDTVNYKYTFVDLKEKRNNLRFISFERSVQNEYMNIAGESLSNLNFKIVTSDSLVIEFHGQAEIENQFYWELPDTLKFHSGEEYSIIAQEESSHEVSAVTTVPDVPPQIFLISIHKERSPGNKLSCYPFDSSFCVIVKISIKNPRTSIQYYAIMVDGKGTWGNPSSHPIPYFGPTDFIINETNTFGFYSEIPGLKIRHKVCFEGEQGREAGSQISNSQVYIFDGNETPSDEFTFTISIPYHNDFSPITSLDFPRLKLLSITKELYDYEKNIRIYLKNKSDPFSEPVYIKSNILYGNGIFSICRSTSLQLKSFW